MGAGVVGWEEKGMGMGKRRTQGRGEGGRGRGVYRHSGGNARLKRVQVHSEFAAREGGS